LRPEYHTGSLRAILGLRIRPQITKNIRTDVHGNSEKEQKFITASAGNPVQTSVIVY
jgi:hypothetical protein